MFSVPSAGKHVFSAKYACQTGSKCRKVIYICRVSIFMSKTDEDMSSFHIYVEKRGKLKYICPNYNIYIQIAIYIRIVIYIQNVNRYIYTSAVSTVRFIYNFIHFLAYCLQFDVYVYVTQFFDIYSFCGN